MSPLTPEGTDPLTHPDPVAAVIAAHEQGRPLLLATAGSTGAAQGVRRSTRSWFDSFPVVADLTGLDERSRMWVPGPPAGTMNLFAAVLARAVGATVVASLRDATHLHLTPTELRRLLDDGASLDGRRATVAGDRLDVALHDRAAATGGVLTHYYGAAELSFVAWGAHEDDLRAFPGVEVREVEGVLWARSPYLADVETDDEGFATVGDHGTVRPDGRVVVHGRGDAAVLTGGATVSVRDVEAVLRAAVPGEVVVVGVPHPDLGEVVAAVVTDASHVAAGNARARAELVATHRPRLWLVARPWPRTAAGKTDRAALRSLAATGGLTRVTPVGAA